MCYRLCIIILLKKINSVSEKKGITSIIIIGFSEWAREKKVKRFQIIFNFVLLFFRGFWLADLILHLDMICCQTTIIHMCYCLLATLIKWFIIHLSKLANIYIVIGYWNCFTCSHNFTWIKQQEKQNKIKLFLNNACWMLNNVNSKWLTTHSSIN